jgi:hypothetical protein
MKYRLLVCALLLSLVSFGAIAINSETASAEESGGLYCFQLAKCSGEAGCSQGGSVDSCIITCTHGSQASCNSSGDDELN